MTATDPRALLLSVHHVGGRSGSRPYPVLDAFERDVINVLYDADPECLPQVAERNGALPSETHVFPHCFAGVEGERGFNLNYDPFTSSLLEPNPDYAGYYQFADGADYPLGEALRRKERRRLRTVTLDSAYHAVDAPVPPPDVLTLDTQGSELEILRGGRKTLAAHVLAVVMEVEFAPLYRDQPLFGAVLEFMAGQGFEFCRFLELRELSPRRGPVGVRAAGVHAYAEALFLRRPGAVTGPLASVQLRKLAFLAIVYGLAETALACLARDPEPLAGIEPTPDAPAYLRFLAAWARLADQAQDYPPTFAERYSFEQSKARFEPGAGQDPQAWAARIAALLTEALERAPRAYSPLESLMRAHGLDAQAERVRARRAHESLFVAALRPDLLRPLGAWAGILGRILAAWLDTAAGAPEAGLEQLRGAAADCPELPAEGIDDEALACFYAVGGILRARGAAAEAEALFTWVLRTWGDDPKRHGRTGGALFHLGELALAQGDPALAAERFRACLERVPEHRQALLQLERIAGPGRSMPPKTSPPLPPPEDPHP
jgi:FkbM family methyltransferase